MTNILRLIPRQGRFLSVIPDFDLVDRFFGDLELPALFGREGELAPAFDIAETEKSYTITGEIPGIEAKDLTVTLTDGILSIAGEKKREEEKKDEHYHRIEREYGSFRRGFRLPENATADKIKANYKDGVLKITLPKTETKTQKIEVKEQKGSEKRETEVEIQ